MTMTYSKIILCGRRCTGKTTLFWDLQKALNWPIFSSSLFLRDYLHRHNLKSPDEIDELSKTISDDIDNRIKQLLLSSDHVIIDARIYGRIGDPLPQTIKILLTTDEQTRIKRAAYREGTTEDVQRTRLIKKEMAWIQKMHTIYPFDFFDKQYFDVTIDTSRLTPEEVLKQALEALQS